MAAQQTFESKFQSALNTGIAKLSDYPLLQPTNNVWSLSSKYADIQSNYDNAAAAAADAADAADAATLISKYKKMADINFDNGTDADAAVGEAVTALGTASTDTDKLLITHLVKYTIKKRAALVYMCLLYIQKLKEAQGKKEEELTKLNTIITNLGKLRDILNTEPKNSIITTTTTTNATATDKNAASKFEYIAKVQTELTALANKKKAELDNKNNLLKDIIPFISKQSELGQFEASTISPAK